MVRVQEPRYRFCRLIGTDSELAPKHPRRLTNSTVPGKRVAVDAHDGEARTAGDPGAWSTARAAIALAVADPSLSGLPAALQRLCRAATSSLSLAGAVVQLVTGAQETVVLASSDESSRRIGNIAFEVGEGPCFDAFALDRPVLVPDLLGEGQARWPGYVSAMSQGGVDSSRARHSSRQPSPRNGG